MQASTIFAIVQLVMRWTAATGKCIKAKQAQGEVIDWSDRLECAVTGLSALEGDIVPLIEKANYKDRK